MEKILPEGGGQSRTKQLRLMDSSGIVSLTSTPEMPFVWISEL
jgi:hypothetical protein